MPVTGTPITPTPETEDEFSLEVITEKLAGFLATPKVDYKVGDKEFKNSQKVDQSIKMFELQMKYPVADIETVSIDGGDIDEFGINHSQSAVPN